MRQSKNTNHHLIIISSTIIYVFLSLLIAVGPAYVMDRGTKHLANEQKMTTEQRRGFEIYVRENCAVCHSQQVRPLSMDSVFGRPSQPSDYADIRPISTWIMTPNVLGTARLGPDLANVGKLRNNEMWNYIHLYEPRIVVKKSIMPSYKWLFKSTNEVEEAHTIVTIPESYKPAGEYIIPTQEGDDLIAYLQYLNQASFDNIEESGKLGVNFTGSKLLSAIYNTDNITKSSQDSISLVDHDYSIFDYIVVAISILVVAVAFFFLVRAFFGLREEQKDHIKSKVMKHE
ncbi:MAG: cbb3-type cytochrome c oxidase subunit II [Dysgonamonadaceae bacterium]|nr:cbb3-type cytochrome c oxidase subunit II [Dysgonamonadaceae bacterium]MDD3356359.1 cbb3-type cytochrome c oxidase subunit II [Dysgonamonadaceae bacterium]